jgi:hypothetical protein
MFCSILVKNYRLALIFNSKNLKVKKLGARKLYGIFLLMLSIECFVDGIAIWDENVKVAYNPADPVQSYIICNTSSIHFIPWAAYKVSITYHAMSQQKSYHCIISNTHSACRQQLLRMNLLTSIYLLNASRYIINIINIMSYRIISYHII